MNPVLIYCYDAYCGWCYGFSPVIQQIAQEYAHAMHTEVLSGGMIITEKPKPVSTIAGFVQQAYRQVEQTTGIQFGSDFLWHIFNPGKSDWFLSSEKPAIALCVFKEIYPDQQVAFAADLQYALNYEGRDLTDDEAYRHLLEKYKIDPEVFYTKLHSETYKAKAYDEFTLCKQLQVTGFPCLFLQAPGNKVYQLARGYTPYQEVKARLENVLRQINATTE
jgi:putative protein-disulfide isomerase